MGKGINTNHFRGQGGGLGSQRSPLMRSWHQHVFGTQMGLFYYFWSSTKNNTKKLMSKTQLGKLQPIQLILPRCAGCPLGGVRADWWALGDLALELQTAGCIPSFFSAVPTTHIIQQRKSKANPSTAHAHTHILLNMFKPLQRLISDFIFSSSPSRARSSPSIIYAFALMNY